MTDRQAGQNGANFTWFEIYLWQEWKIREFHRLSSLSNNKVGWRNHRFLSDQLIP